MATHALVFGQETAADWGVTGDVLARLAKNSTDIRELALATNLAWDQRVSPARASEFYTNYILKEADASSLAAMPALEAWNAVKNALVEYQRAPPADTFANPSNQNNEVAADAAGLGFTDLVNVLDLSGIEGVLRFGCARNVCDLMSHHGFTSAENLWTAAGNRMAEFVVETLNRLLDLDAGEQARAGVKPRHPGWVMPAGDFESFASRTDPDSWAAAVGLEKGAGRVLLVLRYSVDDLIAARVPLYRPTQLDAGPNPVHFPTPAGWARERGGAAVRLVRKAGGGVPAAVPVGREFIHAQVRRRFRRPEDYWIGKTSRAAARDELTYSRTRHHHTLSLDPGFGAMPCLLP